MLPTSSVLQIAASPKLAVTMQNKQMLIDKPLGFAQWNIWTKGEKVKGSVGIHSQNLSNHCVCICDTIYCTYVHVTWCNIVLKRSELLIVQTYCHLHSQLEHSAQAPPLWWGLWWTSVCLHRLLPPTWSLGLLLTYRMIMHLRTDCCIAIIVSLLGVHVLSSNVVMSCLWRGIYIYIS